MAYTMTPWGYDVDGELPPLITVDDFDAMTGGKWANDERVEPAILAASAAIRAHCRWHVYPSMDCRATLDTDGASSLWLPTTILTDVTTVTVNGTDVGDAYQWSRIGQVLPDSRPVARLQGAVVEYEAGIDALPADLAEAVKNIVVRAVALSYGVASESAGGVSISYAANAAYAAASSGVESQAATLAPYRVVRSHAA